MGVSVYPVLNKVLNKELPGFDVTAISGKALAKAVFEEGSAFSVLQQFSSQDAEGLAKFIAEQTGQKASAIDVPAEEWFAPEEGLPIVRSLQYSTAKPPSGWEPADFSEGLAVDLRNLEKALLLAQEHKAKFHLALDF